MAKTVFLGSTCYDLIDLRAELEYELNNMSLQPILSDQPASEFTIVPDASSIESCLVNVRKSDIFIIILSQRYGPSLAKAGYPDVSATHLEYREAIKANKPIFMYIRDRLEADYTIWKNSQGNPPKLPWVQEKDYKIFELLEEHRKLSKSKKVTNWFWTFRNSLELKQRMRKDLEVESGAAVLQELIDRGRIAYLLPEVKAWSLDKNKRNLNMKICVLNAGTAVAIEPKFIIKSEKDTVIEFFHTLPPNESIELDVSVHLTVNEFKSKVPNLFFDCSYTTMEGHYIGDECNLEFRWYSRDKELYKPFQSNFCKRYYHSLGIRLGTRDELNEREIKNNK